MTKVSLSQMQHLSELESRLSKKETVSKNMDFVEEGSPLDVEIKRMKAIHGDDLEGLPPGHPLLRIIEDARRRYDAVQNMRNGNVAAQKTVSQKRVKTAGANVSAATRERNEETEAKRVLSAHKVNRAIEHVDDALRKLMKEIIDNEALINTENVGKLRIYRLKRTADAMRRLLGESKIPGARA